MTRPTFLLTLRAEPRQGDQHDPKAYIRFRRFIKNALRTWGMRCLTYSEVLPVEGDGKTEEGKSDA